jgi:hypothetical protein
MAARIDKEELRSLVRQALKDALAAPGAVAATPGNSADGLSAQLRAALAKGRPAKVSVALTTAADIDRFARDILEAGDQPDLRNAIAAGEIRFDFGGPGTAAGASTATEKPGARGGTFQMKAGVLNEAKVTEIARTHSKILLGGEVALTPLARDKARELKVELVRQKP